MLASRDMQGMILDGSPVRCPRTEHLPSTQHDSCLAEDLRPLPSSGRRRHWTADPGSNPVTYSGGGRGLLAATQAVRPADT